MVGNIPSSSDNLMLIEQLAHDVKVQDASDEEKKVKDLLVEYILANMSGDTKGAQSVSDQIKSSLSDYQKELSGVDDLVQQAKTLVGNPNDPANEANLQSIISQLESELKKG